MRSKWLILFALCAPLALQAQVDTVRVLRSAESPARTDVQQQHVAVQDVPELQSTSDSLDIVRTTTVRHYTDTLTTIISSPDSTAKQRENIIYSDSSDWRGHYIQAYLGFGLGSLGYQLNDPDCYTRAGFSTMLQIQYAQFITRNWGFGVGLWFTNYTSQVQLGGSRTWTDQVDTDLEQHYDHTARIASWRERETGHTIGIPVSAQFQYKKDPWRGKLFAALGLAPAFSVIRRYHVQEAQVAHSGYYPAWDLTLENGVHEFTTHDYSNEAWTRGKLDIRHQLSLFADCGYLLPMTPQIDFYIGGYFNVTLNDANKSTKLPLGWPDNKFGFMGAYNSAYATTLAGASHPWQAGFKVGIHWHYIAPPVHEIEDYFEYFTRRDTTVDLIARYDTVVEEHIDTLVRSNIRKAAEEVERLNKIYFDYDSYELREESRTYLTSIVSILNRVPEAKISIDGHASQEGSRWYNERLAYRRAKTVADYLVEQGVDADRVIVVGHGSLVPNDENVNGELALDRRVEVKVVEEETDTQK